MLSLKSMISSSHKKAFKQFVELCLAEKDNSLSMELFDLFFTSEEKEDLATRYLIVQSLLNGEKTQRQMAKDLNVSISKITRGSNELKRVNPKLIHYLKDKMR